MAAPHSPPRLLPSGDSAITVEFSRTIDDAANRRVLALDRAMASALTVPRDALRATPQRRTARVWSRAWRTTLIRRPLWSSR